MRDKIELKRYIFDAIYTLDYVEFCATVRTIVDYAYYDAEPDDKTPAIARACLSICRKDIDKAKRKADKEAERKSKGYIEWRKAVFERDNYTCQLCGQVGGKLNAHHIKPFAGSPEGRLDVSNGVTLCKECHKEVHRNGGIE